MLTQIRNAAVAAMVAGGALIGAMQPSSSSAFFAWRVTGVPAWDTLNVRAYPSSQSAIVVAYPNGAILSLTGPCTGGLNLNQINGAPKWRQRQAVRFHWCQAWVDPGNGQYQIGWVYGKYIRPM